MENKRLASIDILRSLTMLLMIWVNDFWTLKKIPKWLQHAEASEDYLGFSDIIFPLFLFIVGLSIPLAIEHRRRKGQSYWHIGKHTLIRSASLIIIGVFMVNYETIHAESLLINRFLFCIIMALGVGFIWMNWNRSPVPKKWHLPLQLFGVVLFVFLAIIYKGGEHGELWMTTQWWGILGLIGWAYLINVLLFLSFKGNLAFMAGVFLLFTTLAALEFSIGLPPLPDSLFFLQPIYSGTIPAFTSAGIIATLVVKNLSTKKEYFTPITLVAVGSICLAFGLLTRPIWGISKILGTPSWLGICAGIGFIVFAIIHVVADLKGKTKWASLISAAGTATFTCYMLPYIIDPSIQLIGINLPEPLYIGIIGLIKSFIYALFVVLLTGMLERQGFKLKL
ncbi:heparan-alpha-glucosaminide N-acetyltransferase domain-containing protein [Aegicerativicinus sediminis]|uniref:heparan-alpha-glucosaminide N-acetyltransferase domain-containing protein n=1 Tax=Aegicerativicinus sediminis TaxID=2893202 RepID=UPI001E412527|nr:DUF5009 domain-containing protein [Aegicerativicinus sediminis]